MKYKITNKTGMRLRYKEIVFESHETKVLELDSFQEHEYFAIEKLNQIQKSKKKMKRIKLTEDKQDGISRRME